MIVVSDTSPIINLAAIGRLELLPALFGKVIIPQKVYEEIVVAGRGMPGAEEIQTAAWVEVRSVQNQEKVNILLTKIHAGEAEAIVLSLELKADVVLLDDADARAVAHTLGAIYTGVLLRAKKQGLILKIGPVLGELLSMTSFRISPDGLPANVDFGRGIIAFPEIPTFAPLFPKCPKKVPPNIKINTATHERHTRHHRP